jgi:ribosomal protein S27AE
MSDEERRAMVLARDPEKVRATDRARYYRNHANRRAVADAYQREHREQATEANRRYVERNPDRYKAHNAVSNALRDGKLTRGPCENCGAPRAHAHHDDYSKPLEVRWLCSTCHGIEHRRIA